MMETAEDRCRGKVQDPHTSRLIDAQIANRRKLIELGVAIARLLQLLLDFEQVVILGLQLPLVELEVMHHAGKVIGLALAPRF